MKENYKVEKIDYNTYRIEDSFQDQMYCLVGNEKAALIDTGIGQSGLKDVISSITDLPIIVINTHGHIDHIGTNDEFQTCYLHKEDMELAKEHFEGKYPATIIPGLVKELKLDLNNIEIDDIVRTKDKKNFNPSDFISIEDGEVISLGDRELEVIHLPGHTKGSIGLLEKKTGLLFIGDSICSARVMLSFPNSTNISQFVSSMEKLKTRKADIRLLYSGHPMIPISVNYIDQYITLGEKILNIQKGSVRESSVFGTFLVYYYKGISLTYIEDKLN